MLIIVIDGILGAIFYKNGVEIDRVQAFKYLANPIKHRLNCIQAAKLRAKQKECYINDTISKILMYANNGEIQYNKIVIAGQDHWPMTIAEKLAEKGVTVPVQILNVCYAGANGYHQVLEILNL